MKKILEKDKKRRLRYQKSEKYFFVLNSIYKNNNFFILIRWNAFLKLQSISKKNSKISMSSRCVQTINRKRFNKLTKFSRTVFLKLVRSGNITGARKSSW